MPSAYTALLKLVQPVTGELTNTWGNVTNSTLTQFVENAIAGFQTFSVTSADWTLSTTTPGDTAAASTNAARYAILITTGTPATTRYIYAPQQSKTYVVINNCTDSSSVYIRGGTSSSYTTGVEIEAGSSALVAWDSSVSDFIKVAGGGGGAAGGGSDQIFFENDQTVTVNYTIPTGKNAGTFGPVSINGGITVTVPTGSVWTVV
jgi:hypothetical protein